MSDKPYYRFELGLNRDPAAPSLEVTDLTGQGRPYSAPLPRSELPVMLMVHRDPNAGHDIIINPMPYHKHGDPWGPGGGGGDGILTVRGFLTDNELDTYDDTRYYLRIINTSRHYAAEEIRVEVNIGLPWDERSPLPDSNRLVTIVPPEQLIRRIEPDGYHDLAHLVVTRGLRPGVYPVYVSLAYRIVHDERYKSHENLQQDLPIGLGPFDDGPPSSDECICFDQAPSGAIIHPYANQRNTEMPIYQHGPKGAQQRPQRPAPEPQPRSPHRAGASMSAKHVTIEFNSPHRIPLPGEGYLDVTYRLYKGRPRDWDDERCLPGRGSDLEARFSTQDTATLGLMLSNDSIHHLKHVNVTHIRLYYTADQGNNAGQPVDDTLPDGSPLFDIVPNEVYYGHIDPGQSEVRYLGLVTRGVYPGLYLVHMDIRYELEHCGSQLDLNLRVYPD